MLPNNSQPKNTKYINSNAISVYNVGADDDIINIDTSSGPISIYLPNIVNSGIDLFPKVFYINDTGGASATNNITIYSLGDNTVNGSSSTVIDSNNGEAQCSSSSKTAWFISKSYDPVAPPPSTSTLSQVLAAGNTTSGNNIVFSLGDTLKSVSGLFTTTISWTPPTQNRAITIPDSGGTMALITDAGTANRITKYVSGGLAVSTLLDDGTTIAMDSGKWFTGQSGKSIMDFGTTGSEYWSLSRDGSTLGAINYTTGWSYGDGNYAQIGFGVNNYFNADANLISGLATDSTNVSQFTFNKTGSFVFNAADGVNGITLSSNTTVMTIGSVSHTQLELRNNASGIATSSNTTKYSSFLGNQNSIIASGVINSVMLGGTGLYGKTNNTAYVNKIGYATDATNETLLQFTAPTSAVTQTFQDLSGTIALTANFTTGFTNSSNTITNDVLTGKTGGQTWIGGTAVGDGIIYKGTTGVGTPTVSAHTFTVGNNGGTTAIQIFNSGDVNIGNAANTTPRLLRIGQGTSIVDIGSYTNDSSNAAFYLNQTTPGTTNYALRGSSTTTTLLNGTLAVNLRINNSDVIQLVSSQINCTPILTSSGSTTPFLFTTPLSTAQTASTETIGFNYNMATNSIQHATGALATNRDFLIQARTHRFVAASTLTEAATLAITGAPIAGTNATITRSNALWIQSGNAKFDGRILGSQGADVASANDLTLGLDGNAFEITGTTQINAITTANWQNGSIIVLLFTSNPTVKNNTAGSAGTVPILLAGSSDFSASAGDTLTLLLSELGGTQAWRELARTAI